MDQLVVYHLQKLKDPEILGGNVNGKTFLASVPDRKISEINGLDSLDRLPIIFNQNTRMENVLTISFYLPVSGILPVSTRIRGHSGQF